MKPYKKKLSSEIEHFCPGSRKMILGLSGGPDSVFLGELLTSILPAKRIVVAHFDHRLREDSVADAAFCEQWAKAKQLDFVSEVWDAPCDSEEKARTARLEFLMRTRKAQGAGAIVLGTHGDDEAETIFFRFLRGSGVSGLSGIRVFDEDRRILRPLLEYSKAEILSWLASHDISYRNDPTNAETKYARNFLRNVIFPQLEERFPDFRQRICRQAEVFRRVDRFLAEQATEFRNRWPDRVSRSEFAGLHPAVQTVVVRSFFLPREITYEQTEQVRTFLLEAASGKRTALLDREITVYSEFAFFSPVQQ